MIKWNTEILPTSENREDECNTYYLVKPVGYAPLKAMYMDGEWWTSYISKLMVDIEGWAEIQ